MRDVRRPRPNGSGCPIPWPACDSGSARRWAFDDATAWEHHKTFAVSRTSDNFNFEARQGIRHPTTELGSLVAAIRKELFQEGTRTASTQARCLHRGPERRPDRSSRGAANPAYRQEYAVFAFFLACVIPIGIERAQCRTLQAK